MRKTTTDSPGISRRKLMIQAICAIPAVIGGTLSAFAGTYLCARRRVAGFEWADAGDVSLMRDRTPAQIRFTRAVADGWKVRAEQCSAWVTIDEHRNVTAFAPQCTHLGCAYNWQAEKKQFVCPCHGSKFNVRGDVIEGPASRPLDRYSIKLEGNRLWLGPLKDTEAV
ncbi:MAG: ubiquinol-cytochrome c reductase iron-sulfur subunit [Acidobacteriaceae bacterium]|nr:ubiquinol-cytochrome c reductase iron-sulfur subunit [Acidobacteriaceae bacterium]